MIFIKDVDGLYTDDPHTNPKAEFLSEISVSDLVALNLPTLPFDRVVLDLMGRARLAKRVQIINGLVPGNLTKALRGEPVGTIVCTSNQDKNGGSGNLRMLQ